MLNPEDIHVAEKIEYSGMFGDYSTFSEEMDHLSDPDYVPEEEARFFQEGKKRMTIMEA